MQSSPWGTNHEGDASVFPRTGEGEVLSCQDDQKGFVAVTNSIGSSRIFATSRSPMLLWLLRPLMMTRRRAEVTESMGKQRRPDLCSHPVWKTSLLHSGPMTTPWSNASVLHCAFVPFSLIQSCVFRPSDTSRKSPLSSQERSEPSSDVMNFLVLLQFCGVLCLCEL